MTVTLLPVGGTPHYELGLLSGLLNAGVTVEVIGNNLVAQHELSRSGNVRFFNLRGDQNPDSSLMTKSIRIMRFYFRLIWYALTTQSRLFHIQWENKFLLFDRTILIVLYKILRKKIVYTAHNINCEARDGQDNPVNRLSLRFLYHCVDHIIVHTEKMKEQLLSEFDVSAENVSVITMGLIGTFAQVGLDQKKARDTLQIHPQQKVLLFFGSFEAYKGLDLLCEGVRELVLRDPNYYLILAGRPTPAFDFEKEIVPLIRWDELSKHVLIRKEFIPDNDIETYFLAADCSVLPYRQIYQSAVFFLSYSFGLPIIASDVGSFSENIIIGRTGELFTPNRVDSLVNVVENYFESETYKNLADRRNIIRRWAKTRFSWNKVGKLTKAVYEKVNS